MPPSTWMHSWAHQTAASGAITAATAGGELGCRRESSTARAASQTAAADCSAAISILARIDA